VPGTDVRPGLTDLTRQGDLHRGGQMPVVIKKFFAWGSLAFLIFFIAFRPDGAAQMFKTIGGVLMAIAQGIGDFLTSLMT
jgi:hypothetical protein